MAQLQFSTRWGPLAQTQASMSELVATFNAAYALHGYLGGFDTYRMVLGHMKSTLFSSRIKALKFDENSKLVETNVHVLTGNGPVPVGLGNAEASFGGDPRTQLIGLTLCALAHEIDQFHAVDLFMTFLAPYFFGDDHVFKDALNIQLRNTSTLKRILNEGASRGWTDAFNNAVDAAGFNLHGMQNTVRAASFADVADLRMVAGLLRWVTQEFPDTYKTRCGLVARVALYLRKAGYGIGAVKSHVARPSQVGPHSVLLVLGGTEPTDSLMAGAQDLHLNTPNQPFGKHYNWKTVGATLFQSLGYPSSWGHPEGFQTTFEDIYLNVKERVKVNYFLDENHKEWMKGVSVRFVWSDAPSARPIARSIASIYFPTSSEKLASFYESIASTEVFECVKDRSRRAATPGDGGLEAAVVKFRQVTASIILALVGQLSQNDFEVSRHCTRMALECETWIRGMCSILDNSIDDQGSMPVAHAMLLLGAVHAELFFAKEEIPEITGSVNHDIIGYQSGIYTVLLRLLIHMEPNHQAIGLACSDIFIANLEPHGDGSIRGHPGSRVFPEELAEPDVPLNAVTSFDGRWLGSPSLATPDLEMYLNFERSIHSRDAPLLCLAGRINGAIVAEVGLLDVLKVILLSLDDDATCSHSGQDAQVMNVMTSRWVANTIGKPTGTHELPAFIPTMGDRAWTIFLAGQCHGFNSRIVFRCVKCAMEKTAARYRGLQAVHKNHAVGDFSVLIGYSLDQR